MDAGNGRNHRLCQKSGMNANRAEAYAFVGDDKLIASDAAVRARFPSLEEPKPNR